MASDAAARELYAELSGSFQRRMAPVLDAVLTEACPPKVTIRIDRVEIDVGVVPRDGLMDAIALALREQLAVRLHAPAAIETVEPPPARAPRRLSDEDIALERVAALLEHGVAAWRDPELTLDALETTLLGLIESAPTALRRLLERLPPAPVARRIRTQLTAAARHRVVAWLGVREPMELDRAVADWAVVLAAIEGIPDPLSARGSIDGIGAWLFEQIWVALLANGRIDAPVDAIGRHVVSMLTADMSAADAALLLAVMLVAAERRLPHDNPVLRVIRAVHANLERRSGARVRPGLKGLEAGSKGEGGDAAGDELGVEGVDTPPARRTTPNSVGPERFEEVPARRPVPPMRPGATVGSGDPARDSASDAADGRGTTTARGTTSNAVVPGGLEGVAAEHSELTRRDGASTRQAAHDARAPAPDDVGPATGRAAPSPGAGLNEGSAGTFETAGRQSVDDMPAGRTAPSAASPRTGPELVAAARRAAAHLQALRRETSAGRVDRTFGAEPLWVAHAGAVIVWPFLPGFFDACGLIAAKRFVDEAARARAVLLTAHLATGLQEWGEHDLLLEKTLCGCPDGAPIAPAIDLLDAERQQATELLGSVVGHWKALKSTSIDGLRRAFLCRAGTLTAIASGWKLEIPRAGHDVLLDMLPWGIGVVLLPWMEQPLHVEW